MKKGCHYKNGDFALKINCAPLEMNSFVHIQLLVFCDWKASCTYQYWPSDQGSDKYAPYLAKKISSTVLTQHISLNMPVY
jgi:hypothetical protein